MGAVEGVTRNGALGAACRSEVVAHNHQIHAPVVSEVAANFMLIDRARGAHADGQESLGMDPLVVDQVSTHGHGACQGQTVVGGARPHAVGVTADFYDETRERVQLCRNRVERSPGAGQEVRAPWREQDACVVFEHRWSVARLVPLAEQVGRVLALEVVAFISVVVGSEGAGTTRQGDEDNEKDRASHGVSFYAH
jgi:hypothetical protein